MIAAVNAYQIYFKIYRTLVEWLYQYLPEADARRVVRLSLADLFRWACNAVPTTYGPFGDVAEACMARALGRELLPDAPNGAWPMSTLDPQTNEFHYQVGNLYAAVYTVVYDAQLSLSEREALFQMVRMHEPVICGYDSVYQEIANATATNSLLRRVFFVLEGHECDGRLVCQVGQDIWDDEHRRGSEWMSAHRSREAIAPWPESGRSQSL